ncbi:hypothetical protein PYCCODRAFT_1261572 [Trametes coccinea BRFM310]|uniref:Uncharacterized protein n=1 Tax=Trametes coccinea (strain BRFM310) TaxID=1353009 RepID=A0A1Y2I653_TRAC3|nr:hypothetical protein PYCCODRAFT_1261572 [Trametes coccinea BRFM310]
MVDVRVSELADHLKQGDIPHPSELVATVFAQLCKTCTKSPTSRWARKYVAGARATGRRNVTYAQVKLWDLGYCIVPAVPDIGTGGARPRVS